MAKSSRLGRKNPEETRQKIVEATVALHKEVGPAATTITAIAERADVQRLTVYRHFPDESDVIQACSEHWSREHPLPDSTQWSGIQDPVLRLRKALEAVYSYYRNGEEMLAKVLADESAVPPLADVMRPFHAWFTELAGQLSAGWGGPSEAQPLIRALVGHALRFHSWQSLAEEGLEDDVASSLLSNVVRCAVSGDVS